MLINCAAYRQGRKLADISVEEISDYLAMPETFVWVALVEPTAEELLQMQEEFDLHPLALDDAAKGHQRSKVEEYGDSVFAVLHTVELNGDEEEELHLGEVDIFVGSNYLLSVRHRTRYGFADVRARCEREQELFKLGSGFVFYALMDAVVDRYFPILDSLEDELNRIEDNIFSHKQEDLRKNIEALYMLKQKLKTLKHAVFPLMEAISKLHGGRVPNVCQGAQEYYRDVHDHLARINLSIDNIRDMLSTAIQVNLSLITVGESEVNKKLASWAAIIAVPTLIAGIYGMNFKSMPELEWIWGYPLVLLTMIIADIYLYFHFKRTKWL